MKRFLLVLSSVCAALLISGCKTTAGRNGGKSSLKLSENAHSHAGTSGQDESNISCFYVQFKEISFGTTANLEDAALRSIQQYVEKIKPSKILCVNFLDAAAVEFFKDEQGSILISDELGFNPDSLVEAANGTTTFTIESEIPVFIAYMDPRNPSPKFQFNFLDSAGNARGYFEFRILVPETGGGNPVLEEESYSGVFGGVAGVGVEALNPQAAVRISKVKLSFPSENGATVRVLDAAGAELWRAENMEKTGCGVHCWKFTRGTLLVNVNLDGTIKIGDNGPNGGFVVIKNVTPD